MRYLLLFFALLTVSGCASTDYIQYAKTQEAIEVSKSQAQTARYQALGQIAKDGDSASKVTSVMALALAGSEGNNSQASTMAAPQPNQALQWASILVPGLTQIYGIRANASVANKASDNAAATSIATTAGFVGIAGKIQAPGAISTTNTTTSGNSGAYSGTTAGNSGAYSGTVAGNSGANSGNATATPTVVNQPAPVIVQPATPIVVTQPAPTIVNPVVVTQPPPVIVNPPPALIVPTTTTTTTNSNNTTTTPAVPRP